MAKKSGFVQEFKDFVSRGNVMDMAVGIIIGTAFKEIVSSLVNDILMPFIGMVFGGVDFTKLKIVLRRATLSHAELAMTYGNFIQKTVDFLIIAFVVFVIVRAFNNLRKQAEKPEEIVEPAAPAPVVPEDVMLLTEIRDLLKKK